MQKDAHLVELEKCSQTHIFLQNFALIRPRTSPPKICKILERILQSATAMEESATGGACGREELLDGGVVNQS